MEGQVAHGQHGTRRYVCCSALQCVAVCCSVLLCVAVTHGQHGTRRCVTVCCSKLYCVAVLQCVAVCCCCTLTTWNTQVCCSALQCVAMCGSVVECVAVARGQHAGLLQFVAASLQCFTVCCNCTWTTWNTQVCCSVMQCVAVRCSALQYGRVCCSHTWTTRRFVAVCRSKLLVVVVFCWVLHLCMNSMEHASIWQCAAARCSVLQHTTTIYLSTHACVYAFTCNTHVYAYLRTCVHPDRYGVATDSRID